MEHDLKTHLLVTAAIYCSAIGVADSTLGRIVAADGRFFDRLRDGKTFTAKKYDEVMGWFSQNWPNNVDWPQDVPRPLVTTQETPLAVAEGGAA